MKKRAVVDLPAEKYPVTIEALHPDTGAVVWSTKVEAPRGSLRAVCHIPPLSQQLGHPIRMRIRYGDGTEESGGPPK